ncbi:MAG: hypothetical protein JRN15_05255 [Nitrososphaerota archaeon]|nr:hypothetical protein [Nitrososphaerota archaeon]
MSSNNTKNLDATANQIVLDIKALVLLSQNEEELAQVVSERIAGLHDEHISKFLSMLNLKKTSPGRRGPFLIALGELVLASFLSIAGLTLIAPSLQGFGSSSQFLEYFQQLVLKMSPSSITNPVLPVLDFLLAISLLLGAFYLLRQSSKDLKQLGISL